MYSYPKDCYFSPEIGYPFYYVGTDDQIKLSSSENRGLSRMAQKIRLTLRIVHLAIAFDPPRLDAVVVVG